jgi:tetratricopeptide (TPR) repeat protein
MSFVSRLIAVLAIAAASLVLAASAGAQPSAAEVAVARKLYRDAVALEEAGKWAEAEAKLREAIAIKETPGLRFHLAVTQEKQGKLVEALVDYDRADEMVQRGTSAPDVVQLLGPARDALRARVPTLAVHAPAGARELGLTIDGKTFPAALIGKPIPLNPGTYTVRLQAAGFRPYETEITLAESEQRSLPVKLEPSDSEPAAGAATDPATTLDSGPAAEGASARTLVLVGEAAFTLAALAAGIGFTFYKADRQDQVDKAQSYIDADTGSCTTNPPTTSEARSACEAIGGLVEERDDAAMFATIGFVAAGVGAVATIATYLLWKPQRREPAARIGIAPIAGGASIGIAGSF